MPASAKPFRDRSVDAYEIGSKMSFLDERLFLNRAFYNRYKGRAAVGVHLPYTMPNGQPGFFGDFTSAGKAHVSGAEVEGQPSSRPSTGRSTATSPCSIPKYDKYIDAGVNVAAKSASPTRLPSVPA